MSRDEFGGLIISAAGGFSLPVLVLPFALDCSVSFLISTFSKDAF